MYSDIVIRVFNNPKNTGRISKPDGIADCYNEDKTAHVEFSLRIESGIITKCQFRAQANPYIVAICSTMTEMIKGKMCSLVFLDPYSIKSPLGDESDYDISFCIDCVKLALQDYKEKLEKENKQNKNEASGEEIEETSKPDDNEVDVNSEELNAGINNVGVVNNTLDKSKEEDDDDFFDDDFMFDDFFDEED